MSPNGVSFVLSDRAQALASYPHARRVGNVVYVSGTSCRRPDNTWDGVEIAEDGSIKLDIRKQTRAVLENIKLILQAAGLDLENIVDLTVFLVDMVGGMNEIYNQYFKADTGPTRTTVAVHQLPSDKLLVEIKAIAHDPK
ncbi:Endoribonuclease L-PSP [Gonapodya prolifera JEL478]|uniref:Endoribonuclease L-PSP n=1 Tax=Gonapodya prolifera (strain JEL478) TaxID=1344416 RepID=A0A139AVI6_GONPJ|nr:Endoribonuclease L-PSP [Gonapodya prolifera JEL478]|eukprot:KXS20727.1 Endoribonuclease L-PSP [Gonapodya prolifera JEL478]